MQPDDVVRETAQAQTTPRVVTFPTLYGYPALQAGATASMDAGEGAVYIGGGAWDVPITLPSGRAFSQVAGAAYDWTGLPLTVRLMSTQRGQLGSVQTAGSRDVAAPFTIALACTPCVYLAGEELFVRFISSDASAQITHRIDPITVTIPDVIIPRPMGTLPDSRTITLAPGDAIPSTLLNEIQDVIVSEHASRVAAKTRHVLIGMTGDSAAFPLDITLNAVNGYQAQLAVTVGETIVAARAIIKDSATGPTKWFLALGHNDPTVNHTISADAIGPISAGTGATQTVALTPVASGALPVVVAAGRTYFLTLAVSTGSAAGHLYEMEYDVIPAT